MNILDLRSKLEKGKTLGGEVVYIKEDNIIYGISSIYKNQENKTITVLKSKEDTIKVEDFLRLLNEMYSSLGDGEVFIGDQEYIRGGDKDIKYLEFAQYEATKMLFINV